MNLHEYQAKALFAEYKLPVPLGIVVHKQDEVMQACIQLKKESFVVKAQVHAGGRGKAGGVKLIHSAAEVATWVASMLHTYLKTAQTDEKGQPINAILIEEPLTIHKELYLGAVIDRTSRKMVLMASTEGGMDIEAVAHATPEKILKVIIDPFLGVLPFQARELGFALNLNATQIKQFTPLCVNLGKMVMERDLSLVEVNPLAIDAAGNLICADAKVNIDDNALFRQTALQQCIDTSQEDPREIEAKQWDLNYIALEGDIGCMVNGAGLAMATMDLIKLHGGNPANFLDVGGGATKERVAAAFKIILSDKKVKGILVNIFGGIVRCDLIAAGIIAAINEVGITIPVVVRLEGNRALEAATLLKKSNLHLIAPESLTDAAIQIVKAVGSN